jgi:hypothetical protein
MALRSFAAAGHRRDQTLLCVKPLDNTIQWDYKGRMGRRHGGSAFFENLFLFAAVRLPKGPKGSQPMF